MMGKRPLSTSGPRQVIRGPVLGDKVMLSKMGAGWSSWKGHRKSSREGLHKARDRQMETWLSREGGRISLGILICRTTKLGYSRTDSPLILDQTGS